MQTKVGAENKAWKEVGKMEFFKGASEGFLREIVWHLETLAFLPNTFILKQGDLGDCMYFLTDGTAEVLQDGKQLAILKRGDLFGEMALLYEGKRTASIRALEHCGVRKLKKTDFLRLCEEFSEFKEYIESVAQSRALSSISARYGPRPPVKEPGK